MLADLRTKVAASALGPASCISESAIYISIVGLVMRLSCMLQVGTGKGDADDDDDLEVCVTEFSLRCPLSGSRIRTPARFAGVGGLTAFDLDTFLGMVKRSKKWQCPHSMRNLPVQDLMIDGYLSRILPRLQVRSLPSAQVQGRCTLGTLCALQSHLHHAATAQPPPVDRAGSCASDRIVQAHLVAGN